MTETTKQAQPTPEVKAEGSKKPQAALEDKQLDKVTGGIKACVTGKHIVTGTITV